VALNGAGTTVFQFVCRTGKLGVILGQLSGIGCGVEYGIILVLPVSMLRPTPKEESSSRLKYKERLPIEEVYDRVLSMSTPNFNWYVFIIVAACVASLGLIFDSTATVVSAMLLSPLMDPLIGLIFGTVIFDFQLAKQGFFVFFFGAFIVLCIGFMFGLCFSNWSDDLNWPTNEMASRGDYVTLISGAMIAIVSGIAAGLCVTNGGVNPLVGVAIAASILPPVANSGIMWARAAIGKWVSDEPRQKEFAIMASYSLGLFFINVVNIFISAVFIFRLKAVIPTFSEPTSYYKDIPRIAVVPQVNRPWASPRPGFRSPQHIGGIGFTESAESLSDSDGEVQPKNLHAVLPIVPSTNLPDILAPVNRRSSLFPTHRRAQSLFPERIEEDDSDEKSTEVSIASEPIRQRSLSSETIDCESVIYIPEEKEENPFQSDS
jgi:uncharacterized hydrophobic protein (TIGR00341 family)